MVSPITRQRFFSTAATSFFTSSTVMRERRSLR
jgi:hypothetical protein